MRNLMVGFALVFAVPLAFISGGCSAPTDNTMNRMNNNDNGGDPNYPTGPYGYVDGSTIANYKFLGQMPMAGAYPGAVTPLTLGQFHNDPSNKFLLIEGSANWCYFCNQEAPDIEQLAVDHASQGFHAMTILAEGHVQGVAATADDSTDWETMHSLHATIVGIDPAAILFQYASASAFPLHILLDTRSMVIKWLCVGGESANGAGGCDTKTAVESALSGS
jgi:hypothetical protein